MISVTNCDLLTTHKWDYLKILFIVDCQHFGHHWHELLRPEFTIQEEFLGSIRLADMVTSWARGMSQQGGGAWAWAVNQWEERIVAPDQSDQRYTRSRKDLLTFRHPVRSQRRGAPMFCESESTLHQSVWLVWLDLTLQTWHWVFTSIRRPDNRIL